jgi:tellurite resistance protein TerC
VMRGVMIFIGAGLVERFHWLFYVLGLFLVFTGIKMIFAGDEEIEPEKNIVIRLARKWFPVTPNFDGQRFMTVIDGKKFLTPLALALLMVETTDLIFAVDSIPAIFAVTTDRYIVFTSNVFAILGLRSLYFVLAGAIGYFRYLKVGLSLVLVLIGIKMLIADIYKIPTNTSLVLVAGIIFLSVLASVIAAGFSKKEPK